MFLSGNWIIYNIGLQGYISWIFIIFLLSLTFLFEAGSSWKCLVSWALFYWQITNSNNNLWFWQVCILIRLQDLHWYLWPDPDLARNAAPRQFSAVLWTNRQYFTFYNTFDFGRLGYTFGFSLHWYLRPDPTGGSTGTAWGSKPTLL